MGKWLRPHECPECHKMHSANQKMCNNCWAKTHRKGHYKPKLNQPEEFSQWVRRERGISLNGRVRSINRHAEKFGQKDRVGLTTLREIILSTTVCKYCGIELDVTAQFDHVVPLSKGGTNTQDNIELICKECNMMKHDLLPDQFINKIKKILARWA